MDEDREVPLEADEVETQAWPGGPDVLEEVVALAEHAQPPARTARRGSGWPGGYGSLHGGSAVWGGSMESASRGRSGLARGGAATGRAAPARARRHEAPPVSLSRPTIISCRARPGPPGRKVDRIRRNAMYVPPAIQAGSAGASSAASRWLAARLLTPSWNSSHPRPSCAPEAVERAPDRSGALVDDELPDSTAAQSTAAWRGAVSWIATSPSPPVPASAAQRSAGNGPSAAR